jgi:hypothetical protein
MPMSMPPDPGPTQFTQDPSRTTQLAESTRWRYGLIAVMAAVTVILVAFVFAALRYDTANDVSTALAAITGTVGTILGPIWAFRPALRVRKSPKLRARRQKPEQWRSQPQRRTSRRSKLWRWSKGGRPGPGSPGAAVVLSRLQDLAVLFAYWRADRAGRCRSLHVACAGNSRLNTSSRGRHMLN